MKNSIFSFFFILMLSYLVKAQDTEVEWLAKNTRPEGDTYIEKLISLDNNGYIALRGKEPMNAMSYTKLFLQRYDNEFKAGIVKPIPYRISTDYSPDNGKTPSIVFMGKFSDDVYIITGTSDKENNIHSLTAKKIDPETLDIDDEGIKLIDVTFDGKEKRASYKDINLKLSPDGNSLLALWSYPGNKDQKKKFLVYVFNNKLQLSWQKEVSLNYNNEQLNYNACSVDNNGNVIVSVKLYKGKNADLEGNKINYDFVLFYIQKNNSIVTETKLSVSGISPTSLAQAFDQKGNLVCGGLYCTSTMLAVKGIYIVLAEPANGVVKTSSYKAFSPEYSRTMVSDEVKRYRIVPRGSLEDYDYVIKEIVVLDNGTINLVAEQWFAFSYYSPTRQSTEMYRSIENILCASTDNSGNVKWICRIPKKQDRDPICYTYYDSYFLKIINGKHYFLYNENPENLLGKKSEYFYPSGKFVAVLTIIDENGKPTTNELWDPTTEKVMLVPGANYQQNDKEIIFETKKGKNEYFAKIIFK